MADITIDDIGKTVKDSFYVTVGLGVIAFQKAQVQRQELRRQLASNATHLDELLDDVEQRLPGQARAVVHQARQTTKEARTQLRGLVERAV